MLAQKEYGLNVDAAEAGKTLGVRFHVPNLISELSVGDESIYKNMNGLFLILVRVCLSVDVSPDFVVLQIVDADNPAFKIVFTRHMEDVRKSMAEALSRTDLQDRLLEEFVIGDKHIPFDPIEMDMVRLMMMAMEASTNQKIPSSTFELDEVQFTEFLTRVAENYMRRILRDQKAVNKQVVVREVSASFDPSQDEKKRQFRILLDLVSHPRVRLSQGFLESEVLPLVAKEVGKILRSYRFKDFANILVVEKNSGKMLTVPR